MTPWLDDGDVRLFHGDALEVLRSLPDASVDMVATSPPFYGLRDYGVDGQIGLEASPDEWAARLVAVFRECRRVLADHGTLWVEVGDSYANDSKWGGATGGKHAAGLHGETGVGRGRRNTGLKGKDLLGQPWLLAFALRADGWWLRSEIIWHKPNPMPESVTDRPTKAHSTVFLLSKRPTYFYDQDAIRTPYAYDGRNVTTVEGRDGSLQHRNGERWPGIGKAQARRDVGEGGHDDSEPMEIAHAGANARSVWTIPTEPTPFAHFATWPRALVRRMILAGCPERVCSTCGKPSERITARGDESQAPDDVRRKDYERKSSFKVTHAGLGGQKHQDWLDANPKRTVGWTDCGHNAYRPGVVLDPFAGSGTTLLVARNHGRHAVGIELNEQYLGIAARRLQQLSLLAQEGTA